MSKYGVLVMGPAGAGKVCITSENHLYHLLRDYSDNILLCLDPALATEQTVMLLCQS